jgi:hypothetical protein
MEKKKEYLRWLITPQDDNEKVIFKEKGLIDSYIELSNKIDYMSEEELTEEINNQIEYLGLKIEK